MIRNSIELGINIPSLHFTISLQDMSEKKKKQLTLQDHWFLKEYLEKYPHMADKNGNLTIAKWSWISDGPIKWHDVVSNAMPEIVFSKSGPWAIKSLKVTLGSYEEDSAQLLHYMHKKTEN